MATKNLKFFFQVDSADGTTPVNVTINGNLFSLNHTRAEHDWSDDTTGAATATVAITADNFVVNQPDKPSTDVTIVVSGGDVLLQKLQQDYTMLFTGDSESGFTPTTSTEGDFTTNGIDIISQPLFNGTADTERYDIAGHTASTGNPADLGPGNLEMRDGETVTFTVQHNLVA